ncbi:amidase [Hydrogenophaga sp. ANAO-22]|jgi:aspartyl-tRNA(Asn)/glutamyl-tRNA(Gln) amidotransferase subunit A|uniref:amidase n=1 Tax=Hydrogenophaga sp. ANAO-22 TaxID=3166645 RepID=UPI0036D3ACC5
MNQALYQWSATQIAQAVARRELGVREITRAVLERIEGVDPKITAYARVDAEGALATADQLDARLARGESLGPLGGVPFSVKDLLATAGLETAFGSHLLAGNVPARDTVAVARLRAAGGVLLGKTTTPEYGHKALTSSPRHGHSRNPWHFGHSPGGSSGGSAAAVASGLGPLSLTTDGSGSARIPASACGVLGLKPTLGRIPNENAVELFTNFITLGLATRTVADLALGLQVTAGPAAEDPWSRGAPAPDFLACAQRGREGLRGLRVLVIERMGNERLSAGMAAALERTVRALEDAGATVRRHEAPVDNGRQLLVTMMRAYQNIRLRPMLATHRDRMDPTLVEALEEGASQTLADVQRAPADRSALYRSVEAMLAEHDLLLTPTVSSAAPRVDQGQNEPLVIDGVAVGALRAQWYCYTGLFNLTGHPALSVPAGFDADGLPLGIQLVGPWNGEARLLAAAAGLEAAMPWAAHWPALDGAGGPLPYPPAR